MIHPKHPATGGQRHLPVLARSTRDIDHQRVGRGQCEQPLHEGAMRRGYLAPVLVIPRRVQTVVPFRGDRPSLVEKRAPLLRSNHEVSLTTWTVAPG
jgi:hypothetical protein